MTKDEIGIDWDTESSGGELYKWETVGQKVTGLLTNRRVVNTKLGAMTVFDITTKDGDVVVPATKSLREQMLRYPANGKLIVQIEYTESKKGNFPNPFKVFTVRTKDASEASLEALGIKVFKEDEAAEEEKF